MPNREYTRRAIYPIGPSIAYIPLTQDKFSLVDWDLAASIENNNWHSIYDSGQYYAVRSVTVGKKKQLRIRLHTAIYGEKEGYTVDHKNGNGLDNRGCNLRHYSSTQQAMNRGIRKDNTTGFKGVHLKKSSNRFGARIVAEGRRLELGFFDTPQEAGEAYEKASIFWHGEYRREA